MRISPINNYNYTNNQNKTRSNVSFQKVPSALITVAIGQGIRAIKSKDKVKYLATLKECINSSDLENFRYGIQALSKTPDAYYDEHHQGWPLWTSAWMGKDIDYVDALRRRGLESVNRIPDSNYYNVETKKDFIRSIFENGEEISKPLVEQFSRLNDSLYHNFKEEAVDTAFFSTRYNQLRVKDVWKHWGFEDHHTTLPKEYSWRCKPFSFDEIYKGENSDYNKAKICALTYAFDNLKLLSTLDKSVYASYLARKRNIIEKCKQFLESYFNKVINCGYAPPPNTYNEFINILRKV